jgi:hypothetical protein
MFVVPSLKMGLTQGFRYGAPSIEKVGGNERPPRVGDNLIVGFAQVAPVQLLILKS